MPSEFSREQVLAVAALANLELDQEEVELFARQLGEILAYADEVQQADTTGVPPTAAVLAQRPVERDDEVQPSLAVRAAVANAPDAAPDAGLFKVPRVMA